MKGFALGLALKQRRSATQNCRAHYLFYLNQCRFRIADGWFVKPSLNGLASLNLRPTFALRSTCVSFGHPLAWSSNSYTSRHKLIASQQYSIRVKFTLRLSWTCEPAYEPVWPPIASPYASSGFANLIRRLASPFVMTRVFATRSHFFPVSCCFRVGVQGERIWAPLVLTWESLMPVESWRGVFSVSWPQMIFSERHT